MHVALHICFFLNSCQGFSSAFNGCHISIIQSTTTFALSASTLWFPCEYLICLYKTQGTFETNKEAEEDDIQTDRQNVRRMALVCPMSASLGPCPGASIVCWCRGRVDFLVRCHCALSESLPVSTIEWCGTMPTRTSALCQSLLEPTPPEKGQVTGLAVLWKLVWKKIPYEWSPEASCYEYYAYNPERILAHSLCSIHISCCCLLTPSPIVIFFQSK